ncbi:MAG: dTDP-4-dehydrorhamnose 3,5-epimerase [Actinobacteria bacterium]|nr:dTDP-4-dehydrorhamnose 3,5-epimerase [Actinomycetota bacterium]
MKRLDSQLPGLIVLEPTIHGDSRGWFQETYRQNVMADLGITDDFVQDNHSRSARGVLRGLHFQVGDHPQAKLVRCVRGAIMDVAVDLRRGSPTYGRWEAWQLDDDRGLQLYCPAGFAHGFVVLSDVADVVYRCSDYYDPAGDSGIRFDDPTVGVDWPGGPHSVSDRDATAPLLADIADELPFEWRG